MLGLAGCSSNASYASPNELIDAYTAAGGACDDPQEVGEEMLSEGAHGAFCAGDGEIAMLVVFDSAEDKNRYIARVDTGNFDQQILAGERWAVVADNAADLKADLGGAVVTD